MSHAGFPQDEMSEAIMADVDASALDVLKMLDDKSTNTGRKTTRFCGVGLPRTPNVESIVYPKGHKLEHGILKLSARL